MKVEAKKISVLRGHKGGVYALSKGMGDKMVLSGGSDMLVVPWNLETFFPEKTVIPLRAIIYSICCITEKNLLLVGTSIGSIHVLDMETGQEIKVLNHHTDGVFDIKYSQEHGGIYSASGDGSFAIYSLESFELIEKKTTL